MAVDNTSIGPVERSVRDTVRSYKQEHGFDNYNQAMKDLLDKAGID